MKNTVVFALTLLILTGCATKKADLPTPVQMPVEKKTAIVTPKQNARAVFHIIEPLGVRLVLMNMDKKKDLTVLMDKTLSQLELAPGFYQVRGFILKGKRFKLMTSVRQFVFEVKKNSATYVGSYIFQCPKVGNEHVSELKKMSFFNRYPFSSTQRLCELVVGSDFENVNRVWMEVEKSQQVPLSLGF